MQSESNPCGAPVCRAIVYSMQQAKIERVNISEEVANAIRRMIVDGRLPPATRLNEVHLARDLGVSRTPLREAIACLAREEALVIVPRVGAFVKSLTLDEFDQLYAIRPLLDPEALRLAGLPRAHEIDRLERLNERIAAMTEADARIAMDDEWHLLLIQNCPNEILIGMIRDFISRTRRYELALMRERNVSATVGDHRQIIRALRVGDLEGAARALRQNLQGGYEPIRNWLIAREGGTA